MAVMGSQPQRRLQQQHVKMEQGFRRLAMAVIATIVTIIFISLCQSFSILFIRNHDNDNEMIQRRHRRQQPGNDHDDGVYDHVLNGKKQKLYNRQQKPKHPRRKKPKQTNPKQKHERLVDNPEKDIRENDHSSVSSSSSHRIRQISILGERNSGTRWTWDHLSTCFNHSIPVVKALTRYKHWFQYDPTKTTAPLANPRLDHHSITVYPHDTLVLAQFRNPFDWLKAMQHVPHHAPLHYNLSWKEFLTKPWTMPRVGSDLSIQDPFTLCQEEFVYRDIISCAVEPLPLSAYSKDHSALRYSEHQPFYEMNMGGSGLPYPSILEFRSDKIRNFLSVREYPGVADVWVIQYEYLLAKGTAKLIQRIEEWTGITAQCQPYTRQYRASRPITKSFAKYVNRHLNWTTEAWIGYATDLKRDEKWD